MNHLHHNVVLYTFQSNIVIDQLIATGRHTAKRGFIQEKYGETAQVFLQAYAWYRQEAEKIVPRPPDAESGIWSFHEARYLEQSVDTRILRLQVPLEKVVFFRMSDWNKVLNLRFIGTPEEARAYTEKLQKFNVAYEGDVYTTAFYPHLKNELVKSWQRLFQYDEEIKRTGVIPFDDIQGGLWEIKASWIDQVID